MRKMFSAGAFSLSMCLNLNENTRRHNLNTNVLTPVLPVGVVPNVVATPINHPWFKSALIRLILTRVDSNYSPSDSDWDF